MLETKQMMIITKWYSCGIDASLSLVNEVVGFNPTWMEPNCYYTLAQFSSSEDSIMSHLNRVTT